MDEGRSQTALEALLRLRLPVSGWPWRSAGYLIATLPLALAAFALLAVPWLVLLVRLGSGDLRIAEIGVLSLIGFVLIAAIGPLIAGPLGDIGLRRLRMVDRRPFEPRHRPATDGPLEWLRARYTDPATWREVAFACLLATVTPVLTLALALTALPVPVNLFESGFSIVWLTRCCWWWVVSPDLGD